MLDLKPVGIINLIDFTFDMEIHSMKWKNMMKSWDIYSSCVFIDPWSNTKWSKQQAIWVYRLSLDKWLPHYHCFTDPLQYICCLDYLSTTIHCCSILFHSPTQILQLIVPLIWLVVNNLHSSEISLFSVTLNGDFLI